MEEAQLRLDCECKICFGQVADTLLLPCSHLVLCGWCANQMGVSKGTEFSPRMVQCPVCRTEVLDRIKVFRG
ncbi:hypothetical protein DFP73DRAFT_514354 [Morchella snyderi]|nr:hypothetical protein DFP73DRAFT_514354 [Morchella snyderi]